MDFRKIVIAAGFIFLNLPAEQVKIIFILPEENTAILHTPPLSVQYRTTSPNYIKTVSSKGVIVKCINTETTVKVRRGV